MTNVILNILYPPLQRGAVINAMSFHNNEVITFDLVNNGLFTITINDIQVFDEKNNQIPLANIEYVAVPKEFSNLQVASGFWTFETYEKAIVYQQNIIPPLRSQNYAHYGFFAFF